MIREVPTLHPERLVVDAAAMLPPVALVAVTDQLVRRGLLRADDLSAFAWAKHLDGVRAARLAAPHVRERVDSFPETDVRLLLVSSGLPEPEVNVEIRDTDGIFLARGDLVYRWLLVLVEYDGRHHAESPQQWHKDLRRRERLEAAGWIVVVVTREDMDAPARVVRRVWHALRRRGLDGPVPVYDRYRWTTLRNV